MRKFTLSVLALVACCASAQVVLAEYPDHPIRLVVPQAAGSATDNAARLVGAALTEQLGQQVIIDNKPGGALTVGLDIVAKSAPDGYTIGMGPIGALAITRHMVARLPYDIERDFQPIIRITNGQMLFAASPKLSATTVREVIALAKANPGKLTNASSSNGSPGHVGGELFKFMTGTQIQHVPYRGGSLALNDLMAGHVDLMFESLESITPLAQSGQVRPLAVTGDHRSPAFPDVPTMAEAGVPGYVANSWNGLIAPAGVPRPIIDRLNAAVNKAMQQDAFRQRIAQFGNEIAGGSPEDFAATIRADSAKWGDVVARSGAKLD